MCTNEAISQQKAISCIDDLLESLFGNIGRNKTKYRIPLINEGLRGSPHVPPFFWALQKYEEAGKYQCTYALQYGHHAIYFSGGLSSENRRFNTEELNAYCKEHWCSLFYSMKDWIKKIQILKDDRGNTDWDWRSEHIPVP